MRVLGTKLLFEFATEHPAVRSWIRNWVADAQNAQWATPQDIKRRYPTASLLSGNKVIFNVKGNDYRMVTTVAYQSQIVVVKWIGTHSAYSRINWELSHNETRRD
ncbi:MAG: hypothetical protein C3F08_00350 [Candidatus Methylomirabilota bacterium]|nr:MAG: hypothetical protein C3F08_00350 [candidate division NC10 bacterium]